MPMADDMADEEEDDEEAYSSDDFETDSEEEGSEVEEDLEVQVVRDLCTFVSTIPLY